MSSILEKQPDESRLYTVDFSNFPEIKNGEVITNVNSKNYSIYRGSSETLSLVLKGEVISSDQKKAQLRIEDGTDGLIYKVTITIETDQGNILEGDGYLRVIDL